MANIFTKVVQAVDATLDSYIEKANGSKTPTDIDEAEDRKGMVELDYSESQQHGYKERRGMVGPDVLKSMARKDSIVISIIQTRIGQVTMFSKPQKDKYSPGFIIEPVEPADITKEDKIKLADPDLDEEAYKALKYELDQKKNSLLIKQEKEIKKVKNFIQYCGLDSDERDTTYVRCDFNKFLNLIVRDRLTYNYAAVEMVPTKGDVDDNGNIKLHHFYPVSAGTIRYVSKSSAKMYAKQLKAQHLDIDETKEARYVQLLRGRPVAAWTEDEFVFEAANPSVDPEDNGYAPGELDFLIQTVTSHLYAEAHNRNFFTQGIGTKGLLHIKGDNVSRGQLEAFKRQWFNQLGNARNAFRPPIIGMADDVKWIQLAQSNREMEFESWMHYLIKIICAVYQIDPSEINFDISKVNTSTLNESSNEARLKSSKDKGLKPLLDFVENIINHQILPAWDSKLAQKYKFRFVGLDAESKEQEINRLQKEAQVWRTINEIRTEQGANPIEDGDIILNAAYTQFKQMRITNEQQQQMGDPMGDEAGLEGDAPIDGMDEGEDLDAGGDLTQELSSLADELSAPDASQDGEPSKKKPAQKSDKNKDDKAKKSVTIEYHHFDKDEE